MSNPFEQNSNPWSSSNEPSGPVYGNAYEDTNKVTSPALPPRAQPASPYGTQRMPSPSDYQQPTANAWQESNKTLDEGSPSPQPQNAYQYTGTAYGNPASPTNAYSPQPTHTPTPMHVSDDNNNKKNETIETDSISKNSRPSRIRLLMRFILFVFAVGHLGFAAGASPYSGEDVPFSTAACFYFLFAVAILSIIYSCYHIGYYLFRRFGSTHKMKRVILILCDLLMGLLWGIGIIVEIAKFRCPVGGYNHWCDFYNTSIFFGFVSFVLYVVMIGWDALGACKSRK